VRLPDIDGFAVAERLTAEGGGPAVVVTSSSDDPLYPDRARSTGACGFLAKHDLSGEALQRLLDTARPGS
jgi:DNA-binding NarL/FixJ family response regulator